MSILNIKNLFVAFDKNQVLKDISVSAEDKKFIAIVGPSGCGKTTLLKTIAGMIKPDSGDVFYGSKKIEFPNEKIGFVFQNYVAFPWLSVRDNIAFGLDSKMDRKKKNEITRYFINAVGLKGVENAYISELSGGMRQRVAIATVLARNPDVLLMDEPFSSLDTQTKSLMQELISSIWEESKKTVLFVTHDIEEAIFLADSVYVMSARPGTIKEVVPIGLPRPRISSIKLSQEFFEVKKHLTYLVRGEALKSAGLSYKEINPNSLKIGLHAWPGNSPFYIARELGLFDKNKLDVELIDLEKQENRVEPLIERNVDLFVSTLDTAILAKEKIKDLKIIMALNQSVGGDGLIVNKDISNFNDLKGKKIAVEENWVSHFFLLYLLKQNNLSSEDVKLVHLKGSDIGAALISDKVDAAVTFEPWLTQAKNLSGGKLLASTLEYPAIFDVLVAKEETIQARKSEVKKIVSVWERTVDYYNKNLEESSGIIAHSLMISKVELKNQMEKLKLFDKEENEKFFEKNKQVIEKYFSDTSEIWKKESQMSSTIALDDMLIDLD
ncbi:MAG: ATP-binding cassette domain-containing protein [Patescibacteria group bacterium]